MHYARTEALQSSAGSGTDSGLTVEILGPLRVSVGDWHGSIGAGRVRALLALLAQSPGEVVSMDVLLEELFSEQPSKNPKNALQANVRRLRTFLDQTTGAAARQFVQTSAGGYLLDLPAESVDSHQFDARARRGAALMRTSPRDAGPLLEEALGLWRGPALLDVLGGRRSQALAGHLNDKRLSALEDLYEVHLMMGRAKSVANELNQLAMEHPERERLAILVMLAFYQIGRQADALATFHRVRTWLSSELGLEPGRQLRRLQQAILTQDLAADTGALLAHAL